MRTTLEIDDHLYKRAKATAAERGCTVTSMIEEALRLVLDAAEAPRPVPPLPVSKETGGVLPGVDLHDGRALRALMDEGRDLNALR